MFFHVLTDIQFINLEKEIKKNIFIILILTDSIWGPPRKSGFTPKANKAIE